MTVTLSVPGIENLVKKCGGIDSVPYTIFVFVGLGHRSIQTISRSGTSAIFDSPGSGEIGSSWVFSEFGLRDDSYYAPDYSGNLLSYYNDDNMAYSTYASFKMTMVFSRGVW